MSAYFQEKKGWRYDFRIQKQRYTGTWFPTKRAALDAESERRKQLSKTRGLETDAALTHREPMLASKEQCQPSSTGMDFLTLVNGKLDQLKIYRSETYYKDFCYYAKRWVKEWGPLVCTEITTPMVEAFLHRRAQVSACTANRDLTLLASVFRHGIKKRVLTESPTAGIERFPEDETDIYVPPKEDIERVLAVAEPEDRDYLEVIWGTLARVGEINKLRWQDVDFAHRRVTLFTRKKRHGTRKPRKVPMTPTVFEILSRLLANRDPEIPWVFWHRYWSRKGKCFLKEAYGDRKKIMTTLCKKAGVRYFRFHALRHSGAMLLDEAGVRLTEIQLILGHENLTITDRYLKKLRGPDPESIQGHERARRKSHTESHTPKDEGARQAA